MAGYKFKVEFVVWRQYQTQAKKELFNFLLESGTEEGFNIKEPEFIGKEADPAEKLRKKVIKNGKSK